MINIKYDEGRIRITTGNLSKVFPQDQLPLTFTITKMVSKEALWSTNLGDNMWADYPENEINDVVVTNALGHLLYTYSWNLMEHGSIFYKSLWLYCRSLYSKGKPSNGLVIGTHDGEFGEWVPVVKEHLCNSVVLVEGSINQFEKLKSNYLVRPDLELIYDLITPDGKDVTFFEGGRGYTNSIVERVIRHWETEEILATQRTSTSINDLINEKFKDGLDWLHLDVEGLDAKLLMSLEEKNIPPFIIFEDYNLGELEKGEIYNWLKTRGFTLHSEGGICLANK